MPYFGQPFLPAFGRDQHGLDGVTLPYLAISGTADTTAPIALVTEQGIARLAGTRELVSLAGVKHGFDSASTNDIFTWSLTFLDARGSRRSDRAPAAVDDGERRGRRRRSRGHSVQRHRGGLNRKVPRLLNPGGDAM